MYNRLMGFRKYSWLVAVALVAFFLGAALSGPAGTGEAATVNTTKHNLSTSGPGPIKATIESRICVFCHTPHSGISATGSVSVPLWNHSLSNAAYIVPSSAMPAWATMKSTPQNPPDGTSRLCLSCHDGAVAIGAVVNLGGSATTITMQDSGLGFLTAEGKLDPSAGGYIGTDLSGHHPVSIAFNDDLRTDKDAQCAAFEVSFRLCYPVTGQRVNLSPTENTYNGNPGAGDSGGVQCTSCHDPHDDPTPGTTKFLKAGAPGNTNPLCSQCHILCFTGCP